MTAACCICSLPSAGSAPTAAAGKQITVTDWSQQQRAEHRPMPAYAQATYSIWPDTRLTAGVRYTYDERFAHIDSQTILTPATAATNATLDRVRQARGLQRHALCQINGISYSGQSDLCFLTNANGQILPLSQCAADISKSYHKPT